jgi:hypothetical protein
MTGIECLFLLLFAVVFAVLLVIETQLSSIKVMMEEHTRYDEPLKNGHKKK